MIKNQDRSGWIGASDTHMVTGNWGTKTFEKWWLVKLGLRKDNIFTPSLLAGRHYEHPILSYIGVENVDRQIKIRRLRLRVNLDGETKDTIKEVKTYSGKEFKISRAYWQQAQVEMFVTGKKLDIVSYRLNPEDYSNYFNPIDPDRISVHPVEYDREWIYRTYVPRLEHLAMCLKERRWPGEVPD